MGNRPAVITQADVTRILKGANAAGLTVTRILAGPNGGIVFETNTGAALSPEKPRLPTGEGR
jgi:hypothetical protein